MTEHTSSATSAPQYTIPTAVPETDSDPIRCPYCDRPFPRSDLRDLHVGDIHPESMTEEEAASYEQRMDEEADELFVLHLKVVGALVLLFFAIAYLYAFVLSG